MEQPKRLYETSYIINGNFDDAQVEAIIVKAQELITKNGGEIVTHVRWGRKRFAYPIRHKNNGFYVNIEFNAYPSFIKEFERFFHLEENIVRHLTIAVTRNMMKAKVQRPFILEPIVLAQEVMLDAVIKEELEEAKEDLQLPIKQEIHTHAKPVKLQTEGGKK